MIEQITDLLHCGTNSHEGASLSTITLTSPRVNRHLSHISPCNSLIHKPSTLRGSWLLGKIGRALCITRSFCKNQTLNSIKWCFHLDWLKVVIDENPPELARKVSSSIRTILDHTSLWRPGRNWYKLSVIF